MQQKKDIFRREHMQLAENDKEFINQLKIKAYELLDLADVIPHCREKSIGITELEGSIMWLVKAATAKYYQEK